MTAAPHASPESRAVAKVARRLVPLAMLLYVFNYLDRVNISFAKLEMSRDLRFGDDVYAFGASIFFIGYFLFEVPSNLILQRVGARLWISRIMISWGVISAAMFFVKTSAMFYAVRLLLGFAEAGFFPGIVFYLGGWLPIRQRTSVAAFFMTALPLSGVIGGPLAGWILQLKSLGWAGWQWLFLLEGIPTVIVGFFVLLLLPDGPNDARWLDADERSALTDALRAEHAGQSADAHSIRFAFANRAVWSMAGLYGCLMFGLYALFYWAPSIISKVSHASNAVVGCLAAAPFAAAVVGMVFLGRAADHSGRRLYVVSACAALGAVGMAWCAWSTSTPQTVAALSLAAIGVFGALPPFWTIPSMLLRGSAAAAGIAVINSVGNLAGGLIGPNVIGQLRQRSDSYGPGLLFIAAMLALAAIWAAAMGRPRPKI